MALESVQDGLRAAIGRAVHGTRHTIAVGHVIRICRRPAVFLLIHMREVRVRPVARTRLGRDFLALEPRGVRHG